MALDPIRRPPSTGSAGLRIGDDEREQAVQSLGEHLRAGRLHVVEYDERLEQAFAARTEAELTPLFADLPGGSPRSEPARSGPRFRPTASSEPPQRRPHRTVSIPIRLVLALIAAAIVASVLTGFPFLLIPLVWIFLRHRFGPRHRYGPRGRYEHRRYGPHDRYGYDYAGPQRY